MSATIQIEELKTLILNVYRFDPSKDNKAYMQDIEIEIPALVAISKPRDLRSSRNFTVFALPAFS